MEKVPIDRSILLTKKNFETESLIRTFIVCTVLTGILEIAILERICPPTWKTPIGTVLSRIALVGFLMRVNPTKGLINNKQ